ncbi:ABC transporter permease [Actinoallomurus soli]|uniref:ABC transporter permease n=1 Tax=Actinoallomurus soli TaxID=2952535 RepID=UPI0020937A3B|nr:ABC transporter permease [Actinoallomurus soli]MCO5974352.1 ABC transporter permease [Actinoallomurus soli]
MTTVTSTTAGPAVPADHRPGFHHLLLSEWTKIRSVRSTVWSLILLVVIDLGFTALFVGIMVSQWDKASPADHANAVADPTNAILGSGFFLSQLTVCVLGVMVMASEYSTGMIRASLLAVPRRLPMLVAKATVFGLLILVLGTVVSFASFFIGAPMLHSKVAVSLGDPGVLRAVIGGGLYLAVLGLFAMALGGIIRHTAAGITAVIGFVLVLEPLVQLLPGSFGKHVHAYLPSEAGHLIAQAHQAKDDLLTPWQGFGVFCVWTAVLLVIAAIVLKRRDA